MWKGNKNGIGKLDWSDATHAIGGSQSEPVMIITDFSPLSVVRRWYITGPNLVQVYRLFAGYPDVGYATITWCLGRISSACCSHANHPHTPKSAPGRPVFKPFNKPPKSEGLFHMSPIDMIHASRWYWDSYRPIHPPSPRPSHPADLNRLDKLDASAKQAMQWYRERSTCQIRCHDINNHCLFLFIQTS